MICSLKSREFKNASKVALGLRYGIIIVHEDGGKRKKEDDLAAKRLVEIRKKKYQGK